MGYSKWSDAEKAKIVDRVYELTIKHGYKLPYERGVLLGLVRQAQTVLPHIRQRIFTASIQVAWVEDAVMDKMTRPATATMGDSEHIVATIPAEVVEEKLKNAHSVWELIKSEVRKTPIIETLIESIAEQVVDDIHASVVRKLLQRGVAVGDNKQPEKPEPVKPVQQKPETIPTISISAGKTIQRVTKQTVPVASLPLKTSPIKKPKVVIMGILGRHFTALKNEYGDRIEIIPLDSDELTKSTICKTADLTLMMRKFVSHKHFDRITKQTEKWEYINGAMTEIRERLDRVCRELDKEKFGV